MSETALVSAVGFAGAGEVVKLMISPWTQLPALSLISTR